MIVCDASSVHELSEQVSLETGDRCGGSRYGASHSPACLSPRPGLLCLQAESSASPRLEGLGKGFRLQCSTTRAARSTPPHFAEREPRHGRDRQARSPGSGM